MSPNLDSERKVFSTAMAYGSIGPLEPTSRPKFIEFRLFFGDRLGAGSESIAQATGVYALQLVLLVPKGHGCYKVTLPGQLLYRIVSPLFNVAPLSFLQMELISTMRTPKKSLEPDRPPVAPPSHALLVRPREQRKPAGRSLALADKVGSRKEKEPPYTPPN